MYFIGFAYGFSFRNDQAYLWLGDQKFSEDYAVFGYAFYMQNINSTLRTIISLTSVYHICKHERICSNSVRNIRMQNL